MQHLLQIIIIKVEDLLIKVKTMKTKDTQTVKEVQTPFIK